MTSTTKQKAKENKDTGKVAPPVKRKERRAFWTLCWLLEHLLLPTIVVVCGILLNNYLQSRPHLVAYAEEHQGLMISEAEFLITCPFRMINKGGSITKSRKVTLSLNPDAVIEEIDIPEQYSSFWDLSEGGPEQSYAVISLDLPSKRTIEGSVLFYSNVNIPTKSMCPLKITY
ncbi:MAG: hypothetical protein ACYSWO_06280 [Planctomycetota bacterium]|jgi:hypothetical protein